MLLDEITEVVPDTSNSDGRLKDTLNRFLRPLRSEEQCIFLRRYWYGLSIEELAQELGCSRTRIANILRAYVTLIITDQERAASQLRMEGPVAPDGILVYLPFRNDEETNLGPEVVDFLGCGYSFLSRNHLQTNMRSIV